MIRLYLDENLPEAIAVGLRLRGYDVVTVKEVAQRGLSDIEQIRYAALQNRVIVTFNVSDFYKLHAEFAENGEDHGGIILSRQLPVGSMIKGLLKMLAGLRSDEIKNRVIWLRDYIE